MVNPQRREGTVLLPLVAMDNLLLVASPDNQLQVDMDSLLLMELLLVVTPMEHLLLVVTLTGRQVASLVHLLLATPMERQLQAHTDKRHLLAMGNQHQEDSVNPLLGVSSSFPFSSSFRSLSPVGR
jgi:hypothetical protein